MDYPDIGRIDDGVWSHGEAKRELKSNTQFTEEELEELLGLMFELGIDTDSCVTCGAVNPDEHDEDCLFSHLTNRIREELEKMKAESQGVDPIIDPSSLAGTWPGEDDDGFEESIDKLRHPER